MKNREKTDMPLATELLHDMKVNANCWKFAFFAMVEVEVLTLIVGYILLK